MMLLSSATVPLALFPGYQDAFSIEGATLVKPDNAIA